MTRGRAWIVVLGLLLGGIVALNVWGLGPERRQQRDRGKIDELQQDNSVLARPDRQPRAPTSGSRPPPPALGLAVPLPTRHYLDGSERRRSAPPSASPTARSTVAPPPAPAAPEELSRRSTDHRVPIDPATVAPVEPGAPIDPATGRARSPPRPATDRPRGDRAAGDAVAPAAEASMKLIERRVGLLFAAFALAFRVVMLRAAWLQAVRGGELSADARCQQVATVTVPGDPRRDPRPPRQRARRLRGGGDDLRHPLPGRGPAEGRPQARRAARRADDGDLLEALDRPTAASSTSPTRSTWSPPSGSASSSSRGSAPCPTPAASTRRSRTAPADRRGRRRGRGPLGASRRPRRTSSAAPTARSRHQRRARRGDQPRRRHGRRGRPRRAAHDRRPDPGLHRVGPRRGRRDATTPRGRRRSSWTPRTARSWRWRAGRRSTPPTSATPTADLLANMATGYTYEPGSTFKAFTVAGALEDGTSSTPDTTFDLAADDPGRRPDDRGGPRGRRLRHPRRRRDPRRAPRTSAR